ncbi:MAG: hypothetical protein F4X87_07590 [Chloroflexi bacterium]|nr:hypothetical protein [Chloroflexota bacterium]
MVQGFDMDYLHAVEQLDVDSWLVDGVFVNLQAVGISRGEHGDTATRFFWIGIDRVRLVHFDKDIVKVVNLVIAGNRDLGIKLERVMDYIKSMNWFDYGLHHSGLLFYWKGSLSERFEQGANLQPHFDEADRRSLDSIAKLIAVLKLNDVPLSEQPPYSPKNTWLNHFRPTIDHLMGLGPSSWLPALTLSISCIDAAYQDWHEDRSGKRPKNPYTKDMLSWLFDLDSVSHKHEHEKLKNAIDLLCNGLANGLKHDTLMRKPITLYNPYLRFIHNEPPDFSVFCDSEKTRAILSVRADARETKTIMVYPPEWWETVRSRIDRHYQLI